MLKHNNWGDLAQDVINAIQEGSANDLPRQEFETSRSGGIIHMRPARRAPAFRGAVPTFSDNSRLITLHNLCLRFHVYFAVWAGGSGAVTFLDIFDGPRKIRYECSSDWELEGALLAATEELSSRLAGNGMASDGRLSGA